MYGPYQLGKQSKSQYNKNQYLPTMRHLELLHIDLMGAIWTVNINGRKNTLMVVDDFFIYTWVIFLIEKSEAFAKFNTLCIKLQNEKFESIRTIIKIRSAHGKEFKNSEFKSFCDNMGI